jgi:Cytochrome c3
VLRHNGKLYEGRVSYYTAIDGLDWTIGDAPSPPPSLEEAMGRDISGDEARNCFSCHGTAAVTNTKLDLNGLIPGVTCEACHGPGQKHAVVMLSDVRADPFIFNPKTLDPDRLSQEFCGACHRGVDTVAMMPDLGGISNVRFQPYRLYNSRGHDPKDARLACTACHDPHSVHPSTLRELCLEHKAKEQSPIRAPRERRAKHALSRKSDALVAICRR